MSLSMYEASVPVFRQMLGALAGVLEKAIAHEQARKLDPATLPGMRLYPDMLPLGRQVMIAGDFAKNTVARVTGQEVKRFPDDEKTLAELLARVRRTDEVVAETPVAAFDGSEDRDVSFTVGGQPMTLKGRAYLLHFAMPNFYFHTTTAYAILRHAGVEVGKRDFMGR